MAIPPAYADLGKSAKDIFNKGYGKSRSSPNMYYFWSFIWTVVDEAMLK